MVSDRVGDFITRLTNAGAIGKETVLVPYSALLEAVAKKLQQLGYVAGTEVVSRPHKMLSVTLAFDAGGHSRIHGVKRVSKPGRRLYVSARDAHGVKNGVGARIISTPKGVLSDAEARKQRAGGENLFEIW